MPEDDGRARGAPVRMREPRQVPRGDVLRTALLAQFHGSVVGAEAQPRAGVHDDAQAIEAFEVVRPAARLVAVEDAQERVRAVAREHRLHLRRQRERLLHRPRRQEARVHHREAAFGHDERARGEPCDERVAVRRVEDRVERVAAMRLAMAGGDGEQVEVVVAEHGDGGIAERHHLAQHGERSGAAVDEVADEPQPVARAARSRSGRGAGRTPRGSPGCRRWRRGACLSKGAEGLSSLRGSGERAWGPMASPDGPPRD